MNGRTFLRLFPNASRATLEANGALQYAEPERDAAAALEPVAKGKESGPGRITVRITGFRVRPLDPDNHAGGQKDIIDGLRRAKLLPDDSWRHIRLETEQEKVSTKDQERTEIELIYP